MQVIGATGLLGGLTLPGMTYLEAAVAVLRKSGRPMTSHEITAEALRRGLIRTTGKTPEATMAAALYTHVSLGAPVKRLFEPGNGRAKRGTVRWTTAH